MSRRLCVWLIAVLLVEFALPASAVAASPNTVANATAFRISVGLRSDTSWVQYAEGDPSLSRKYGHALTAAEVSDLDNRERVQIGLGPVATFLETQPDFAGLYMDQHAGGVVTVFVTSPSTDQLVKTLSQLAPAGTRLKVEQSTYTMTYLKALQQRVDADLSDWTQQGIDIVTVGVDIPANRLVIAVASLTPSARQTLEAKYGAAVRVDSGSASYTESCTSPDSCNNPIAAGASLYSMNNGSSCTMGYWAKAGSTKYVITAGHCIRFGGAGAYWTNNTRLIGQSGNYWWSDNAPADAAILTGTIDPGPYNNLLEYAPGSYPTVYRISGWTYYTSQLGALVCKMGKNTYWQCGGRVIQIDTTVKECEGSECHYILHQAEVSLPSGGGDSGGPIVTAGGSLFGITAAMAPGVTWYSPVNWVDYALGVTPCTTPSC